MTAADALAWLMTYALHSTLLLGGVWLLTSRGVVRSHHLRDFYWKVALVGGLVTATGQVALRQLATAGSFPIPAARSGLVMDAAALPAPAGTVPMSTLVFIAWSALAALAVAGLAGAHLRLARRLGRREPVTDASIVAVLDALRLQAEVPRPVRLTQSAGLGSPI